MAGSGSGSKLPSSILWLAGVSALVAVAVSLWSIFLQFRNYRKPALQRMVVRIMLMVPLYAIASLISLHSVEAAFVIDAIRDIYEAFVIYCFFVLLLVYLGGERSLLIMLHGRPPKEPVFPVNLVKREIDVSDPYTFLFLKRGILQYVQVKPVLAAATLILKACGKYNEGVFRFNSGYLYISIVYNTSICLALYCLAMFWVVVNDDLKPFRPVPKFLCVKGILFFSFWQAIGISLLVTTGVITHLGIYTDPEHVSVGLNDLLICVEMPFFAFAHMYAFSYTDFISKNHAFVARMPIYRAFRDAFGLKDVVEDTKATLRGKGMDYREFEPAEGFMHQGIGRERRIRAGLRYSKGGQRKYWLPKRQEETRPPGRAERFLNTAIKRVVGEDQAESVHAPLLEQEAEQVYHNAPDMQDSDEEPTLWDSADANGGFELPFGDVNEADEELFANSRQYLFGDYNYPVIDCSSDTARLAMWDEEERVLRDERGAWFSPIRGGKGTAAIQQRGNFAWEGYGAVSTAPNPTQRARPSSSANFYGQDETPLPPDIKVIDHETSRLPPVNATDVAMKWTNSRSPKQRSNGASPSRPASRSGGRSSPETRLLSPPSVSRTNSQRQLPQDAVDLVVSDPHQDSEEVVREHRRGEPASRVLAPGLRKVYSQDLARHQDGSDPTPDRGRDDVAGVGTERMEESRERTSPSNYSWVQPDVDDRVVATSTTPPPHARVFTPIPDDGSNPWA